MSAETKTKNTVEPKQEAPASAAPIILRCKVLKNGLRAGGGVSASGKILNLPQQTAAFHEGRGEVRILGTK